MEPSGGINSVSGERHGRCYHCGKDSHFTCDRICPALEATCSKCHIKGHYADRCKTKPYRVPEAKSSRKKGKGGGPEAAKSAKRGKGRG